MFTYTSEHWKREYEKRNALFIHDPNKPTGYHPELTSGMHSDGFFFSKPLMEDDSLLTEIAKDLVNLLHYHGAMVPDCVVGPQTGATKLAEFLAARFSELVGRPIAWCSPAKFVEGGVKKMLIDDVDHPVIERGRHLLCDDVISTASSVGMASDVVMSNGGIVLPELVCLVNRSAINDRKILSLLKHPIPQWKAEDCPRCKEGSIPIKPKEKPENWGLLIGKN